MNTNSAKKVFFSLSCYGLVEYLVQGIFERVILRHWVIQRGSDFVICDCARFRAIYASYPICATMDDTSWRWLDLFPCGLIDTRRHPFWVQCDRIMLSGLCFEKYLFLTNKTFGFFILISEENQRIGKLSVITDILFKLYMLVFFIFRFIHFWFKSKNHIFLMPWTNLTTWLNT